VQSPVLSSDQSAFKKTDAKWSESQQPGTNCHVNERNVLILKDRLVQSTY